MTRLRMLEYSASGITLAGMYVGSTTKYGVMLYAVSTVVWWGLMLQGRLWGLLPLNVGSLIVTSLNAIRIFG